MLKEGTFVKKKYNKVLIGSILGWLVAILGGMTDSIIAGLFMDSNAVPAVGLITSLRSITFFLAQLICVGCAIMYSTALAPFEVDKSRNILSIVYMLDLSCYVAARVMETAKEKAYTTATSFNRNTYIWNNGV